MAWSFVKLLVFQVLPGAVFQEELNGFNMTITCCPVKTCSAKKTSEIDIGAMFEQEFRNLSVAITAGNVEGI